MSLNWATVLGGSGRPRFLICGTELIANQSFEANTYGWIGSPSTSDIAREQDSNTFWGDYSCKVTDAGAQVDRSKARCTIQESSALAGRSFALSFYVRSLTAVTCSAQLSALDEEITVQEKAVTTSYKHFLGIFAFATSELNTFSIDIRAVAGGSYANDIYIDKVSCREISYDLYAQFPYPPNKNEPIYNDSLLSTGRLVDGTLKEYVRGWEPNFVLEYDYLDAQTEYYRLLMSEASFIWFQPHADYAYWVAVKWDRQFEQRYFGNVFAGHVGKISFKPIFLLESKPLSV